MTETIRGLAPRSSRTDRESVAFLWTLFASRLAVCSPLRRLRRRKLLTIIQSAKLPRHCPERYTYTPALKQHTTGETSNAPRTRNYSSIQIDRSSRRYFHWKCRLSRADQPGRVKLSSLTRSGVSAQLFPSWANACQVRSAKRDARSELQGALHARSLKFTCLRLQSRGGCLRTNIPRRRSKRSFPIMFISLFARLFFR
jgi:hypothetical protein